MMIERRLRLSWNWRSWLSSNGIRGIERFLFIDWYRASSEITCRIRRESGCTLQLQNCVVVYLAHQWTTTNEFSKKSTKIKRSSWCCDIPSYRQKATRYCNNTSVPSSANRASTKMVKSYWKHLPKCASILRSMVQRSTHKSTLRRRIPSRDALQSLICYD